MGGSRYDVRRGDTIMRDGFRVIDADRHSMEPSALFHRYLPRRFRGRVRIEGPNQSHRYVDDELISDSQRLPRQVTGIASEDHGVLFAGSKRWREIFADGLAAGFDPASNLHDMDREGVDLGVRFPTLGLYIMWRDHL